VVDAKRSAERNNFAHETTTGEGQALDGKVYLKVRGATAVATWDFWVDGELYRHPLITSEWNVRDRIGCLRKTTTDRHE
jgi:hypothetical protein